MPTKRAPLGLTLIELLIVLVVIAILVTIALPNLLSARIATYETSAISTMHQIIEAQVHFSNAKAADVDQNGIGEFGTFAELAGSIDVRDLMGGTRRLHPAMISPAFRAVTGFGELQRGGYLFRIYLPDAGGRGLAERPWGGADATVDASASASYWCVYAWPQDYGTTGRRAFFANQSGNILFTEDPLYSGPGAVVPPGAAVVAPGDPARIDGQAVVNEPARDGNAWRIVGG